MDKKKKSTIISLAVGAALLIGGFVAPAIGVLTAEMVRTICVIVSAVVLWVKKPIPLAVSSLTILALLPIMGLVPSLNDAFAGFSNPTNFFVITSFGLAIAVRKTTISNKILVKFLSVSQGKTKYVVLAYMIMTYAVSAVMSDIAAVMIGVAFAQLLVSGLDDEARPAFGRLLMLSLPFASIIGGTSTPAGSSVNVMALNLLSENTGIEVSFLQWCAFGMPVSLLMLIAAWLILTTLYKADDLSKGQVEAFVQKVEHEFQASVKHEGYVVAVIILMIVAWLAGTWIRALNTTTVAIFGLLLLIMPGIGAFDWKEFSAGVPWEIFLMGGATITLGSLARSTGIVQLLADSLQANFASLSPPMLVLLIGTVVTLILVVMPVGPATVSMLVMPIYAMVSAIGLNPVMAVITLGIFASNSCILPLNAVQLLSFSTGYWKITDLMKAGILVTIVWLTLSALWFPIVSGLVL